MKHTIDAQGKKIGRVASKAAAILMGKHSAVFRQEQRLGRPVEIVNAAKADVTAKKKEQRHPRDLYRPQGRPEQGKPG